MDDLSVLLDKLGLMAVRGDPLVVALTEAPERTTTVPRWGPLEVHLRAARKRLQLDAAPKQNNTEPPCCPPAADAVTLGAWDFANAILWGECDAEVQNQRLGKCAVCAETRIDAEGHATAERLYRLVNGAPYCGEPWTGPRNPYREGCGCPLRNKVKYRVARCPRGLWEPGVKDAFKCASGVPSDSS